MDGQATPTSPVPADFRVAQGSGEAHRLGATDADRDAAGPRSHQPHRTDSHSPLKDCGYTSTPQRAARPLSSLVVRPDSSSPDTMVFTAGRE